MLKITRPFPFGEHWAVRCNGKLCVFVNDTEAYEFWRDMLEGRD